MVCFATFAARVVAALRVCLFRFVMVRLHVIVEFVWGDLGVLTASGLGCRAVGNLQWGC